jgi:hypothetical protein
VAFTRRILNSLMTIFLAELFGWVSNTVVHNALNWMNVLGDTQWYIMSVVGYFMQIALAMNPVILFILRCARESSFFE